MANSPIIIIGGGIAGLACALALGTRDTLILEQAPAFSEAGAGLQLGPNAVRALQKLGAWDSVEPITSSPPDIQMRDGFNGKVLKRLSLGKSFEQRFGAPYRVVHRKDLHRALLDVVKSKPNIEIRLNEIVTQVNTTSNGAEVLSKGVNLPASAVLATDGVHSKIRQQLFANSAAIDHGEVFHRSLFVPPKMDNFDFDSVTVWLYPNGHVVHYRVGTQQRLNLIAVTPKVATPQQHFRNGTPILASLLAEAKPHFSTWPALYAPPLSIWSEGNILLLGDAAHATLPYLAQGAAMALEDAACLKRIGSNTLPLLAGFKDIQRERFARTGKLHRASLAAGRNYHHAGLMRNIRNIILPIVPEVMLMAQLSWIYRH